MILTGSGPGGSGVAVLARVLGNDGNPITQSSITAIAWTLTDLTAGAIVATGAWTVATTVFNTLIQNDPRWSLDSVSRPGPDGLAGYNLLGVVPAADFAVSVPAVAGPGYPPPLPHQFQVDVTLTPASGQPFRVSGLYLPDGQVYG